MYEGKFTLIISISILLVIFYYNFIFSIPINEENYKENLKFRRGSVKNSTIHVIYIFLILQAWKGYEKYAFGHDELKPVSNSYINPFGGFGVNIIDNLDTLYLMNLTEEYNRARDHILKVNFKKNIYVGVFETTIRIIGGFLGAYTLTNDKRFIQKAKEMADLLLPGNIF